MRCLPLLKTSIVLSACAFIVAGCAAPASQTAPSRAIDPGLREMLAVPHPLVGGGQGRLADFKGKIVLLHFFSSWCAQCAIEAPTLRNLHNSFKDSKFSVVGVAVDDDPFQMLSFVSKYQLPFPVLMDSAGELKAFFSVKELPSTLVLDRRGVPIRFQDPDSGAVTAMLGGPRVWDSAKAVEMFAQLVENL